MTASTHIVGVLNVTPDSFSDGGEFLDPEVAAARVETLLQTGAQYIDIGADSTRPGSECVGDEEEWRRLEPVLERIADKSRICIDTHSMPTARRAIKAGVRLINDISGGSQEMLELIADTGAQLVVMYSRCPEPHQFHFEESENIIEDIKIFFDKKIDTAQQVGLSTAQLIFDPGMGGFIGKSPETSLHVLEYFDAFSPYGKLYLGVSRKGFLKASFPNPSEVTMQQLDEISSQKALDIADRLAPECELYIRSHNVEQLVELRHAQSISHR